MSIGKYLDKIRNAVYGREVRESIAKGIETAYNDASEKHDNANMEVKLARGTHSNLNNRLKKMDEVDRETTTQLAQNVGEVNRIDNSVNNFYSILKDDIKNIKNGSPKDIFETKQELENSFPNGDNNIYLVLSDGNWYYWNNKVWKSGGKYQSSGLADESVKTQNISETVLNSMLNDNIKPDWEHGSIDSEGELSDYEKSTRIRTVDFLRVKKGTLIELVNVNKNPLFNVSIYDLKKEREEATGWLENSYVVEKDCYIKIILRYEDRDDFDSLPTLSSKLSITFERIGEKEIKIPMFSEEVSKLVHTGKDTLMWEKGYIGNSDGLDSNFNESTRIRTKDFVKVYKGSELYVANGVRVALRWYNTDLSYVVKDELVKTSHYRFEEDAIIRLVSYYVDEQSFDSLKSLSEKIVLKHNEPDNREIKEVKDMFFGDVIPIHWEYGHLNTSDGKEATFNIEKRIRSGFIKTVPNMLINLDFNLNMNIYRYNENKELIDTTSYGQRFYLTTNEEYIRIVIEYKNGSDITNIPDTVKGIKLSFNKNTSVIPPYMVEDIRRKNIEVSKELGSFNFAFITDSHDYFNHLLGVSEMSKLGQIEAVVNGGDMITGTGDSHDDITNRLMVGVKALSEAKKPVYNLRGNHDLALGVGYNKEYWHNTMVKPFQDDSFIVNQEDPFGGYYYVDHDKYKVRMLMINTTSSNSAGTGEINEEQLEWVAKNALDLSSKEKPSEWHVIATGHHPIAEGFSSEEVKNNSKAMAEIFKAYKEKKVFHDKILDIYQDFSEKEGSFVGYIFGHIHRDNMIVHDEYGYLMASTLYSYCNTIDNDDGRSGTYASVREIGTKTEYAFDIYSFDLKNNKLKTFRIGAGEDRVIEY